MAALPSIGSMMDRGGGGGEGSSVEPSRKRLRVSHACDVCRARKIRCDGNTPCAACAAADCDCTYGSEANSRGKSDLILEGVLRLERMLQEMNLGLATAQQLPFSSHRAGSIGGSSSFSGSPLAEVHLSPFSHHAGLHSTSSQHQTQHQQQPYQSPPPHQRQHQQQPPQQQQQQQQQPTPTGSSTAAAEPHGLGNNGISNSLENAVLDSMHTSTTESILQWPHFDVFPSLRRDYVSIFTLERGRRPPRARGGSSQPQPPRVTPKEVGRILDSFQGAVNLWYPTASVAQLERCRAIAVAEGVGSASPGLEREEAENGDEDEDDDDDDDEDDQHAVDSCLASLVMALGCASQVVAGLVDGHVLSDEEMRFRRARRRLGDLYFDQVLRSIHVVHTAVGSAATHCLFLVGLYFAFLRRPLQAWEYINAASARCLLLLSYQAENDEDDEDQERIRRIFCDYLAELSGLPQSGIAHIESSIPLPGKTPYKTHRTPLAAEQSSLYFLACISMRRLLNRVHQLLYARGTGASLDTNRFPYVVAELDHQLEDWRDVLPAAFAFTLDARPCSTEHGGFLRQRYLTCRSVIYRPYLMWMLSGAHADDPSLDAGATARCLDACLLHMLNLRGFGHTVLVDTWICALSMAGAMCLLLAACRTPALRDMLAASDVLACGRHLGRLFESWTAAMGGPRSPSIEQSVRIIAEADRFIREFYSADLRGPDGGWSADTGRRDELARG
ncbi:hypothetical protein MCOR25_000224 [Pyricularia grisea]|nr:hypothetical protein MCOR25_000224 [Pyricularia grisea]